MTTRIRFLRSVRLGVAGAMACRMGMDARMHSRMLTNMAIDLMSGSVGSISAAMREIAQQRGYNEVNQPNQEASNKHK